MNNHSRGTRSPLSRRRGAAVVMILMLLSLSLGLSYAMMRTQTTEAVIHENSQRSESARNAALAGMSIALRQIHSGNWAGADTGFGGRLSSTTTYSVQYVTGDATISPGSAEMSEFPYRLTITATGIATDPQDAQIQSKYKIQVVTQLVRNYLEDTPSGWDPMATKTLFQTGTGLVYSAVPVKIKGKVHLNGPGRFCWTVLANGAKARYLDDLEAMRIAGLGDFRPYDSQFTHTRSLNMGLELAIHLNVPVGSVPHVSPTGINYPSFATYQLYPGGKVYAIDINTDSTIADFNFQPDPESNPLGILHFSQSSVSFQNNVNIVGSVITRNIQVHGTGISLRSPDLQYSQTLRLPAVITDHDIRFHGNASADIDGSTVVLAELRFQNRTTTDAINFQGPVMAYGFNQQPVQTWFDVTDTQWDTYLADFQAQLTAPGVTPIPYFPVWLKSKHNLDYEGTITIDRGPANVIHHWHDWTKPLYGPHPSDGGLRWDVIKWNDLGPA